MHGQWQRNAAGPVAALGLLIGGCGAAPTPLAELNASYERALVHSASLAVVLDGELEQRAFGNLAKYFDGMSPESVRAQTATVYAPTGYLNDTLVGIQGVNRIEAYFGHTMENASLLTVEFLDRAPAGIDWYVRWRMTAAVDGVNDGLPVTTYGVSQLRFDSEGRVLLHKDFWDSGSGLYEHLPVIGTIVGRVRAAVEAGAGELKP